MLKGAPHHLVVMPTGDNNESEKGKLIVVANSRPEDDVLRGVITHVGAHVPTDGGLEQGAVAHYTAFFKLGDYHVVPLANLIAFEVDDDE